MTLDLDYDVTEPFHVRRVPHTVMDTDGSPSTTLEDAYYCNHCPERSWDQDTLEDHVATTHFQQLYLFGTFTVHCFFGWCTHVESDAQAGGDRHDRMEAHYRSTHQSEIRRLVADNLWLPRPSIRPGR